MKIVKLLRRIVLGLIIALFFIYMLADKTFEAVSFMYADF